MNYRREIDGLRALAVLPVILFHADFQGFSGGFVGVDIFFVISGYLITSILIKEIADGSFSLMGFYERRARRILPVLYFVMAITSVFAYLLLWPNDMLDFGQSLIAVSLFGSNFLFWAESGYFETAAELKPLLHTWSLAVEEQYYIFFPLLLLVTRKFRQYWVVLTLLLMSVMSLALAEWSNLHAPSAAFFLLPSRGWELLVGALTAYYLYNNDDSNRLTIIPVLFNQMVSLLGLLMVLYSVSEFNSSTPFPGLYAVIPTLGAVLVILCATPSTLVGRLLGSNILVGIGLVSYSAYLWHQPLFAFARHQGEGELSSTVLLTLTTLSFIAAYFSWRFIEQPFRDRAKVTRRTVFTAGVGFGIMFILFGNYINNKEGFVVSFSDEQKQIMAFKHYDKALLYREGSCFLGDGQMSNSFSVDCASSGEGVNQPMIWGDSHAAALYGGLNKTVSNLAQYTTSGCPPALPISEGLRTNCNDVNSYTMKKIGDVTPSQLFLHANWYLYNKEGITLNLTETIEAVRHASPGTEIVVVGGVPRWSPSLPTTLLQNKVVLGNTEKRLPLPLMAKLREIDGQLEGIAISNNVRFVSALDLFCNQDKCLALAKFDGDIQLTAWDKAHLTEAGATLLAKAITVP